MARKVFISFLGYTNYKECRYHSGKFISGDVRYIQEATLDYLQTLEEWNENDVAYILLTAGAKEKNWLDDGHKDYKTNEIIRQAGLCRCLAEKKYPFPVVPVEGIPDGNDEQELYDIFSRIYGKLQDGDELYFDVTHGFRSLPMLALVLVNYAKFLRHISVKSITYGNYEARSKGTDGKEEAPIINLLPLSQIQDWTFAAADFLKNGNADRFEELTEINRNSIFRGTRTGNRQAAISLDGLAKRLKEVVDDFLLCRGIEIIKPEHIRNLDVSLRTVGEEIIPPLVPLVEKLIDAFSEFTTDCSKEQINNGFVAARWCIDHNLYQQAATILQETVVTFFCKKHKLLDGDKRKMINQAFKKAQKLGSSRTPEKERESILNDIDIEETSLFAPLMSDDLIRTPKIYNAFSVLTDERNDINHNGMRKSPHSTDTLRNNIKNCFTVLNKELKDAKI